MICSYNAWLLKVWPLAIQPPFLDGRVGAVVFEGRHFVTSPNMEHIYAPPLLKKITFKKDLHLGEHDELLWPQPFLEPQCHLACIPRCPEVFEESHRSVFNILFHPIDDTVFYPLEGGPITGLGFLSGAKMASLKKLRQTLEKQLENLDADIASTTPILNNLIVVIRRMLTCLEHLPMTKSQALFLFAAAQRHMLEYLAAYRYLTIYKPRMLNTLPPATGVEDLVGAFVFTLADTDNFVRAGIPVWVIRPAALAGTVRVEKLVELIEPRDRLCLQDAYDTYPVAFTGTSHTLDKYRVFARYSATFLSYTNPFSMSTTLSSPSSSNTVNVFAPPQVSGASSSGPRHRQFSSSSARHIPCIFLFI